MDVTRCSMGTIETINLRGIERAKTDCAGKLFSSITSGKVKYGVVNDYNKLLDLINGMK